MKQTLLRNAQVKASVDVDDGLKPVVKIKINDQYSHTFGANSVITKQLEAVSIHDLEHRLNGGHYFMSDGNLIDFRGNEYNGFIHSDEGIGKLIEHLGVSHSNSFTKVKNSYHSHTATKVLGRVWSKNEIQVEGLGKGGLFKGEVGFLWNPFYKDVSTNMAIERLICENGMVATKDVLNYRIPIVNEWDEHLEIASTRLHNKFNSFIRDRLQEMTTQRASVGITQLIYNHALARLNESTSFTEFGRLKDVLNVTNSKSPELTAVYNSEVFEKTAVSGMLPSHITSFDAWNFLTELDSHTTETKSSTGRALQMAANQLLFDSADQRSQETRLVIPKISQFSDPDDAFMGALVA